MFHQTILDALDYSPAPFKLIIIRNPVEGYLSQLDLSSRSVPVVSPVLVDNPLSISVSFPEKIKLDT